jgi:hypothetical protein
MLTGNGVMAEGGRVPQLLSVDQPSVASRPPNDPVSRPAEPVVDLAAASPSSPIQPARGRRCGRANRSLPAGAPPWIPAPPSRGPGRSREWRACLGGGRVGRWRGSRVWSRAWTGLERRREC